MPCISVALMDQYLDVRQRKLGTIIIQTVHIQQHDSADTGFAWSTQITSNKPSPAIVSLHLCTNRGGFCTYRGGYCTNRGGLQHYHILQYTQWTVL